MKNEEKHEYMKKLNAKYCYNFVFVDGELYQGYNVFNCYKGMGWDGGRVFSVQLKDVSKDSECFLLDNWFGKLRKLTFIDISEKNWNFDPEEEVKEQFPRPISQAAKDGRYSEWRLVTTKNDED